jgi:hypothetical protein
MSEPLLRHLLPALLALGAAATFACATATELRPAPEAERTAGRGLGATAQDAGVEVEARVHAWAWEPSRLETELTPVLVQIVNGSVRPLRVRLGDFALVDGAGRSHAALPPYDIEAEVAEPIEGYAHGAVGFRVAPYLGTFYPRSAAYSAFAYDPLYYSSYYPLMSELELPTADMLAHALPEGVVEPGGRVAGFLYFELVEEPAQDAVRFRFALFDATSDERFGQVEIPFRAERTGLFTRALGTGPAAVASSRTSADQSSR